MPTSHKADATIERIVAAATLEFASHGIAGARIDRLAKAARTSKERVYAHFRGKEALYRHVAGRELAAMADAVDLDPRDLPDYAGRLHDHALKHPERHRLMLWGQLELAADAASGDDPIQESLRRKLDKLREAQKVGDLDADWAAEDVLVFVTQLATSWAGQPHLVPAGAEQHTFMDGRRAAIVTAVQRLFPSQTAGTGPAIHAPAG